MFSYLGMMRSARRTEDYEKTIAAAEKVLESDKLTEELAREATFLTAKANQALGNNAEALDDYTRVGYEVGTVFGAESKYHVAELLYADGKTDEAEKVVNAFIDLNSPHAYWTGKVFLLLSDISVKKGDTFQAKATLQSLIDYYTVKDDGIIEEARAKLSKLNTETATADSSDTSGATR